MRNRFASAFFELGKENPKLAIVVADISPAGSIAQFREHFPDRFINTGVAEQVMIGLCAGMAQRGMQPFAYTIATFAFYRPFEMIRDDLCYQNLPVTIVGMGAGVTYSTLGATHHAQEDVSVACALPNMSVIAPCDPSEAEAATRWCAFQKQGPVYLRLGKAGEPNLTRDAPEPWTFGKCRLIRPGKGTCIISYGPIMKRAVALADRLRTNGVQAAIVSFHTIKPIDQAGLARIFDEFDRVIVIEECSPQGGLAMQVKMLAWEHGARCRLDTFSLKDSFIHLYGTHDDLLDAHGLSVDALERTYHSEI